MYIILDPDLINMTPDKLYRVLDSVKGCVTKYLGEQLFGLPQICNLTSYTMFYNDIAIRLSEQVTLIQNNNCLCIYHETMDKLIRVVGNTVNDVAVLDKNDSFDATGRAILKNVFKGFYIKDAFRGFYIKNEHTLGLQCNSGIITITFDFNEEHIKCNGKKLGYLSKINLIF